MIALSRRFLVTTAVAGVVLYAILTLFVASGMLDTADLRLHAWVVQNMDNEILGVRWSTITAVGGGTVSTLIVAAAAFLAWRSGAPKTAVIIVAVAIAGGVLVDGFKDLHGRPYPSGGHFVVVTAPGGACPEGSRCDVLPEGNASVYCPPGSRCNFYEQGANGTYEESANTTWIPSDLDTFPTRAGRAYPSGHTMGATLSWGLALILGTRAVQKQRGLDAWAIAAWGLVAFLGGVSRIPVHAHWWTDVVASWFLGIALLAVGILLDDRWKERERTPKAGQVPSTGLQLLPK